MDAFLGDCLADLEGQDGPVPPLLQDAMRYAVLGGGKRLRPILALTAAESVGGRRQDAIPVAAALELIHAYSLVHDDLPALDDDAERRGQPTVHVRFGIPAAILAGDALLTEAFRVLTARHWGVPDERKIKVVALVAEAAGAAGMVGGQQYDIEAMAVSPTPERVTLLHAMKTGALFRAAVVGGGLAAGAALDQLALLDRYGRAVGRAFQLTDDILDLEQSGAPATGSTGDPHEDAVNIAVRLGTDAARAEVVEQVTRAVQAADALGDKATMLVSIARFVQDRRS